MTLATVPIRVLRLYVDRPFTHTGTHLRGSILSRFPDRVTLHNHREEGPPQIPDVRFLVVDRVPHVVALGEARDEILEVYRRCDEITAADARYRVTGSELLDDPVEVGVIPELRSYRSQTPWLGLNQENHRRFDGMREARQRAGLLGPILVGNLLVTLRRLGVELPAQDRILLTVHDYRPHEITVRGVTFTAFDIDFVANLEWTHWLGIGKQPAKGFGLFASW